MIEELEEVQRLLIAPNRAAMLTCEQNLEALISGIRQRGVPARDRIRVNSLVRNIRFLLDQANTFWRTRQLAVAPALQYSSGGWVTLLGVSPTLNIEI